MKEEGSILNVLRGSESLKLDVKVDVLSITLFGIAVFVAVLAAVVISNRVK
jgi:hypothetical protein